MDEAAQKLFDTLTGKKTIQPRLTAISYYGGKFSHLGWLLPLIPYSKIYCEPFAGSGAVLLNREPSPIEIYNDLYGEIVNFFTVLRESPRTLISQIALTPVSREEFLKSLESNPADNFVERARRFYVRHKQGRDGLGKDWSVTNSRVRNGIAESVSKWLFGHEGLFAISERLKSVQVENDDAVNCIRRYDSPDTTFYVDPPYCEESRATTNNYRHEFTVNDHMRLADALHKCKGKICISGYRGALMDNLYHSWDRVDQPVKSAVGHSDRTESIWRNLK